MITKTINLYTFGELSDNAKEKARQWWRDRENESFSDDLDLEWIETAAKLLGITFKQRGDKRKESCVWWELHRQGAGASFDATYSYSKGSVKAVAAEFPKDEELNRIARELAVIQKEHRYKVSAVIKSDSRGHYFTDIDIDRGDYDNDWLTSDDAKAVEELFKDFAQWIYKYIAAEWDHRMSDEYVDDAITANEYTFTVTGEFESK